MITSLLLQVISLFKFALFARIIIDYVRMFKRDWRPSPFLSSIFEVIYSVTDPPMKFVQRFVPPLRVGGVALDCTQLASTSYSDSSLVSFSAIKLYSAPH